ncbi:hypothetical protein SULI_08880 [Saccharolobus solfataricus]|uniref:CARDB domain-containing protein n=3 Tax=Saccharolobus solfataricus TaxID=2287 RepID=Q7LXM5_SACS2|nr:hypothetical protein [Saccharolobus solfataricus]AAK40987.1 Hypothetical protein SSO0687 [Saccharolobus solfataricus P2]AKA74015.1 hypothetical protein SULB_1771 [Saccharolobus solfataricus]AKA76712.1 hypothetical protein SULC_1769 [Saccharolobus solfataricus]AKA79406.1 hypothetical protein SULA_1770 [Saccharolobus solfataricus]AZF68493.1 hypothetical protein SULG_08880 [Saccharolobus solfataricus]
MSKIFSIITISLFLVSLLFIPLTSSATQSSFSASSQWLSSTPYVTPGERLVQLQVNLVYHGNGNITNVEISPIESGPFIVYPSTQTYILPSMFPNQQYSLVFIGNITPNIPLGVYNFYLQATYLENGAEQSQIITVQIPILGYVQLSAIAQTSGTVFPGEQYVPINLVIYNTGTVTANNVALFLNSTYPLQFITKEINIPIISAGSSLNVQAIANIYNNATIGTYKIPLTAFVYGTYHSLNVTITINSNQTVGGKLITPYVILPAGSYQLGVPITLQLIYTGPISVSSYSIQLILPNGFTNITGGNSVYINGGPLQPYEEFTVSFTINIRNVSLGAYTIPLKIIWSTIEGNGVVVNTLQYMSFTMFLMGQPNIEVYPETSLLYPGEVNNITLVILNLGSGSIYNLSLSVSSQQVSILNNLPKIQSLSPTQSVKIPLEVYVPSTYQGAPVQFTISISYLNSVYQQSQYQQQIGLYVSPLISPNTPIIASLNPGIISPNSFTTTYLVLTNSLNTTLYNLSITLSSPVYVNATAFNLPSLKPTSKYELPITVYAQGSGSYSISISIVYYQGNIERQEQITVPVYVIQINSPTIPILIQFNSSTLLTGQVEDATIIIQNTVNQPLYNVTISLASQGTLYINTTTITLPSLQPLQRLDIPVKVYTQSAGIISISASISYYQAGQLKQAQEVINSLAAGSVNIIITGVSSVPTVAVRGGIVSVTATIYNFGTGPANGLTVTVFPPRGVVVIGQNTYYVGNLGSDTSSTFTFAFRILNSTKPGSYVIPIEYTYTNDIGQVIHSNSSITLQVSNSSSSFFISFSRSSNNSHISLIDILGIIIVIIVVVVLVIVLLRKRR